MKKILLLWIIGLALSISHLSQPEERADVEIGMLYSAATVHPLIASKLGFFEEEGITYRIRRFGCSPEMVLALAAGEIDAAYMSISVASIWKSKGTDIYVVSGAAKGGDYVLVRDPGIKEGRIGVSQKGSMTSLLYEGFVQDIVGFEPAFGVSPADMRTALLVTEEVDAVLTWEPFASLVKKEGAAEIMDVGEEWKKMYGKVYPRNVFVVSGKVAKDRELLDKLLRIHKKTIAYLNKPGSIQLVEEAIGAEVPEGRMIYDDEIDWEGIKRIMSIIVEKGYMDRELSKGEIIHENH